MNFLTKDETEVYDMVKDGVDKLKDEINKQTILKNQALIEIINLKAKLTELDIELDNEQCENAGFRDEVVEIDKLRSQSDDIYELVFNNESSYYTHKDLIKKLGKILTDKIGSKTMKVRNMQ